MGILDFTRVIIAYRSRNRKITLVFHRLLRYIGVMSTIQITLSEPLQRFVVKQVAERGLDQPDQYIEQLLEEERRKKRDEYYYQKCLEGIASGPGTIVTDENREAFWNGIKERVRQRQENRRKKESVQ